MTWICILFLSMRLCAQNSNADSEQPARTASGGVKAEQHPQSQPEAVPYQALVPTDATVNSAALAALAAAQAVAASGPDAAEFWRQRAGQLAGSGVDLTQLAASAAGQSHVVQVGFSLFHNLPYAHALHW